MVAPAAVVNENDAEVEVVGLAGYEVMVTLGPAVSGVSIVQVLLAAVASVLAAASVARTAKVWTASVSPEYEAGLTHAVNAPASTEHANEAVSVPVNENVAELDVATPAGPPVIEVSGAAVSMTHV